jgi:hypothetical protein
MSFRGQTTSSARRWLTTARGGSTAATAAFRFSHCGKEMSPVFSCPGARNVDVVNRWDALSDGTAFNIDLLAVHAEHEHELRACTHRSDRTSMPGLRVSLPLGLRAYPLPCFRCCASSCALRVVCLPSCGQFDHLLLISTLSRTS